MNIIILMFIALVLYLIWDKLNQRIAPKGKGFGESPNIYSSSGPGYMFGGGAKGKDY